MTFEQVVLRATPQGLPAKTSSSAPPRTKIGTPGAACMSLSIVSRPWLSGKDVFAKIAHTVFWSSRCTL